MSNGKDELRNREERFFMPNQILPWIAFNLFVVLMLALDLGVFHRKAHVIGIREALWWSGIWIVLALLFNVGIYFWLGSDAAVEFLAGYLIERSLSIDNIFVFLLVFSFFQVSPRYHHKVLFWGILGALIMRIIFIAAGVALIQRFHFVIYIFGVFLVLTGIKMALKKGQKIHPERNPVIRLFRRFFPVTKDYERDYFFVRKNRRYLATPLFIVLLVIETTDLIFAVDSIPAIFAVTLDPFIVYTSNVFAILGLRALYFVIAGAMRLCLSLHYAFAAILILMGAKMLLADIFRIPTGIALAAVAAILAIAAAACMIRPEK